ncbi:hypothetical protein [Comamonas sp. wu1-DMT]|uniref:hypothetical protein n=1 Tax=Comamonas sp. wu1-DMT TaxID=3126390 RepID=UPI0032E49783
MADFAHDMDAQRRLRAIEKRMADGGGAPPHNDGMEERVKALEEAVKNLPTKADFAELRADVKTGISDLRAEMHKTNIDIHKWMIGTVIGLFLGFGGLFLAMSNALKQSSPAPAPAIAQPATPSPIIINVPSSAPAVASSPATKE